MSNQITEWNIQDYKSTVALLLQQRGSKLAGAVLTDSYQGKAGKAVNQIGAVNPQKRTSRHADTPLIETPHDARWVFPTDYEWADLIDDQDKLRVIADPTSAYAINGAMALGRAKDAEILSAFFGTSKTGENGTTSTSFDTTNQVVAVDEGAGAATGLNIAKLRAAKKILMANEVDVDNEPLYIGITADDHDALLSETQAVSLDYTNKPALVDGRITAFMGFNFIHIEMNSSAFTALGVTMTDGDSYNRLPVWCGTGMHLGMWNDITTMISERADKSYASQVYVKGTYGATRTEEKKVVEIKTTYA